MTSALLSIYITGALMFLWCVWFFERRHQVGNRSPGILDAIEAAMWWIAVPVATIRALMDRRRRG